MTGTRPDGKPEISNIIVPQDTPGFTRSKKYKKMGWRASDTRELSFADAQVPEENLLGQRGEGYRQFLTILDGGRISVAALSIGLAMGAYDEALAYAKERHAFGKPISKFQAISFKLVDMLTEIEHAKLMMLRAAWEKDRGRDYVQVGELRKALCRRSSRIASSTKRCRSTAATASWTSIRSRACTAIRRSTRSAKGPTRFSA